MTAQTEKPKITAIAPWFGGKRTLASTIVAEFGPHQKYDEPFCGSLAVLFEKEPATMETVNDLHGGLICLARTVADEEYAPQLYSRLTRTWLTEDFHRKAKQQCSLPCPLDVDDPADIGGVDGDIAHYAYWYFVASWFGRNGVAGTASYNNGFCVRYTKNGGHAATRFVSAVESIPAWHHRLRTVTILRRDAFEIIERMEDTRGCVIYCDPPYIVKGAEYVHDFADGDHERLSGLLGRFKRTRVVVSYYDHPSLADLYPGWTKRRLKATKALVNQGKRDGGGAVTAPEVLLINGPSLVGTETELFA